jgi:hypothetical protein
MTESICGSIRRKLQWLNQIRYSPDASSEAAFNNKLYGFIQLIQRHFCKYFNNHPSFKFIERERTQTNLYS